MQIEAYVYDGYDLICKDCYWDKKTTDKQRKRCKPVFDLDMDQFEEPLGSGVGCAWCHEWIREPEELSEEEDDEEEGEEQNT